MIGDLPPLEHPPSDDRTLFLLIFRCALFSFFLYPIFPRASLPGQVVHPRAWSILLALMTLPQSSTDACSGLLSSFLAHGFPPPPLVDHSPGRSLIPQFDAFAFFFFFFHRSSVSFFLYDALRRRSLISELLFPRMLSDWSRGDD